MGRLLSYSTKMPGASSGQEWYACVTDLLQEGFKSAMKFKEALLAVAAKSDVDVKRLMKGDQLRS